MKKAGDSSATTAHASSARRRSRPRPAPGSVSTNGWWSTPALANARALSAMPSSTKRWKRGAAQR